MKISGFAAGAVVLLLFLGIGLSLTSCSFSPAPTNKVLLIGIDGAEWDLINPLIEKGQLPNLASLKESGAYGDLQSLELMLSPIIWTSIATGKSPEKHGITWFLVDSKKAGQRIPVTSTTRKCKALWNILSEEDKSVGVVGWWATYPAEDVNGFIVSDHVAYHTFGVSGRTIKATFGKTHPRPLYEEVRDKIPDPATVPYETVKRYIHIDEHTYNGSADEGQKLNLMNPISHFRQIYATAEGYRKIGTDLYKKHSPDLMAVYFEGVDSSEHLFMHCMSPKLDWTQEQEYARYMDVVTEMYKKADEIVGEFLEIADENTTIIVVSDHGFETGAERIQRKSGVEVATAHLQHKSEGVVILSGPPIRKNEEIFGSSVLDVAPTILYLLGLPVAEDMDGLIIEDAIDRDYFEKYPPEYIETYEDEETEVGGAEGEADELDTSHSDEMVERLKALGYIGSGKDGGIPAEVDGNMARIKRAKGKLTEAVEEYEKALAKKPNDAATHHDLAQVCRQLGQLAKAVKHSQTATRLDPDDLIYKFGLAGVYEAQERFPAAVEIYESVLAASPEHAEALSNLGNAHFHIGKIQEAKAFFDRAIQADPTYSNAWFNLGVIHEKTGALDLAIESYKKTVEFEPNHISALVNMGNCYDRAGELEMAIGAYEQALIINENHAPAHFNIGLINSRLGKHEEASENLTAAIAIDPDLVPPHREFFFTCIRLNESEKAAVALDHWMRLAPADPDAWFQKARFLFAGGNRDEGFNTYTKCVELGGDMFLHRGLNDPLLQRAANHIASARLKGATPAAVSE